MQYKASPDKHDTKINYYICKISNLMVTETKRQKRNKMVTVR